MSGPGVHMVTDDEMAQLAIAMQEAIRHAGVATRHAETVSERALASIAASLAIIARIALTDPDGGE